jgi:hypothetical protein
MTALRKRLVIVTPALLFICVAAWALTYPSPSDPKNIEYIFWKAGLYEMNLDTATGTMIGDPNRDKLVLAKTKAQLQHRFGRLLLPADASPYLRGCYQNSPWKDRDVLFIRQSPWMIVFEGDRATELVLIKGC